MSSAKPIAPSQLKSWSRCRKQFYYKHVLRLDWPVSQANFELGKAVHRLLDYHARGLAETAGFQAILESIPPPFRHSYQLLAQHPIAQLPIVASEWVFHVPMIDTESAADTAAEPIWLTGQIDRIAWSAKTNELLVIDWKTGTAAPKQPERDWQTIAYCYAVVEAWEILGLERFGVNSLQPEQVVMVYVEVSRNANAREPIRVSRVPYSSARHAEVKTLLSRTLQQIKTATDYPLPSVGGCPDAWCQYRSICGVEA